MTDQDWVEEFPAAVTVCDADGNILMMNQKERRQFNLAEGETLAGRNLADCHSKSSNRKIKRLMRRQQMTVYTVEEYSKRELIIQGPWYQNGKFSGLVEISIDLAGEILHVVRK